MSRQGAFR